MEIKVTDLKKSKYSLSISLSPEELLSYFQTVFDKLAPEAKIAGFRPGKAPRRLIEEAIGQNRLLSEGLDAAIQSAYFLAIKKENLLPISLPKIAISKYPAWGLSADEIGGNLEFEAEIEVMPQVKLGNYSKIKIKKKKSAEIKKDDVEKILLHLRRQKATFSDLDRGAENGDRLEINFSGSIDKVKKDPLCSKNQPLVLGDGVLIPGFEKNLLGMKKGEKKKFPITFPVDYQAKEFGGKRADFEVEIVDLKAVNLPDLDNHFASHFGHKDIDDLCLAIEKSLKTEIESKARNELETEVIEKVLPKLEVILPDGLVEQEIDRIVAGMKQQIENRGITLEKYFESIKKSLADLRRDLRPTAKKNIRVGFLLGKIIEERGINQKEKDAGRRALDYLISQIVK